MQEVKPWLSYYCLDSTLYFKTLLDINSLHNIGTDCWRCVIAVLYTGLISSQVSLSPQNLETFSVCGNLVNLTFAGLDFTCWNCISQKSLLALMLTCCCGINLVVGMVQAWRKALQAEQNPACHVRHVCVMRMKSDLYSSRSQSHVYPSVLSNLKQTLKVKSKS